MPEPPAEVSAYDLTSAEESRLTSGPSRLEFERTKEMRCPRTKNRSARCEDRCITLPTSDFRLQTSDFHERAQGNPETQEIGDGEIQERSGRAPGVSEGRGRGRGGDDRRAARRPRARAPGPRSRSPGGALGSQPARQGARIAARGKRAGRSCG